MRSLSEDTFVDGIVERLDLRAKNTKDSDGGTLAGLTFAVKDMFEVAGKTAGFGSPDWKATHEASKNNALCIDKLLSAGAHLVANTICDELAFSLDGINIHYGTPFNPRAPERIPGGSSSGPASVVAQGLVDFALGTDTAGSTRVPSSYCGIWGLRPTLNSISCQGVLPLGPSFDTVGLLASSLAVLERVAGVLIESKKLSSAKTLIVASDCFELLDPALLPPVVAVRNRLSTLFSTTSEKPVVEDLATLVKHFSVIRSFEAWHCHGPWYEKYKPELSEAVAKRLLDCRGISEEQLSQSRRYRRDLQVKFGELLGEAVICLPTTAKIPPLKSAGTEELEANRSLNLRLNVIGSFLGLPQLTIPIADGESNGRLGGELGGEPGSGPVPGLLPGLSLIGAEGSEEQLLRLASELTT